MRQNTFDFVSGTLSGIEDDSSQPKTPFTVGYRSKYAKELHEVLLRDEGGIRAIQGFEYQHHFGLKKCIELLSNSDYEFVSFETHDDVATKRTDGSYEFYQVKLRSEQYWSVSDMHQLGVWSNFLRLFRDFGPDSRFFFVSSQASKRGRAPRYDLAQMKDVTRRGKDKCNVKQMQIAETLIDLLHGYLIEEQTNRTEIEQLFWRTRILTDYEHEDGLIAKNLIDLWRILSDEGAPSTPDTVHQVYRQLRDLLADKFRPQPELNNEQLILRRQVNRDDIQRHIRKPIAPAAGGGFSINDETDPMSLIEKTDNASFPHHIKLYFLESRNYFSSRFREDYADAADYLGHLRRKVWGICVDEQIHMLNLPTLALYSQIRKSLKSLAESEISADAPIQIDIEYLHGILCQLTAECHHDWIIMPNPRI